jgi:sugar lactone lactonase YvrE
MKDKLILPCTILLLFFGNLSSIIAQNIIPSEVIVPRNAQLGEGSIWNPTKNILYWIDIDQGILYSFDPITNIENHFELGQKVGTVVPIDTGGVLVALKDGIYAYNLKNHSSKLITSPEKDKLENRFNDGKCDPAGRFWVGSLGPHQKAALYRIDFKGNCKKMIDSVSTSNGIVWTSDKKTMYYIDTPTGCVNAFDYDNNTGDISNNRIVIRFTGGIGYPDGMTIDSEDMLWIAHWGGSCVGKWNPKTGKLVSKVEVPAPNVTSCAFGGKDLETLFITTASVGLSADDLSKYPQSGMTFKAKPGAKGVKANFFSTR